MLQNPKNSCLLCVNVYCYPQYRTCKIIFLEFFCMGGWEEEVPYSSLLSAQQDEYPSYKSKQNYFQRRNYNSYVVSDEETSPFGDMVRQK